MSLWDLFGGLEEDDVTTDNGGGGEQEVDRSACEWVSLLTTDQLDELSKTSVSDVEEVVDVLMDTFLNDDGEYIKELLQCDSITPITLVENVFERFKQVILNLVVLTKRADLEDTVVCRLATLASLIDTRFEELAAATRMCDLKRQAMEAGPTMDTTSDNNTMLTVLETWEEESIKAEAELEEEEAKRLLNEFYEHEAIWSHTTDPVTGNTMLNKDESEGLEIYNRLGMLKMYCSHAITCAQKARAAILLKNELPMASSAKESLYRMKQIPAQFCKEPGNTAFLKMVYNEAASRNFRHDGVAVYKELTATLDNGTEIDTYVWERHSDLGDFVRSVLNPAFMQDDLQGHLFRRDYVGDVLASICNTHNDARFRRIKVNSDLISCPSGIYDRKILAFYPFGQEMHWGDIHAKANARSARSGDGEGSVPPTSATVVLRYCSQCVIQPSLYDQINNADDIDDIDVNGIELPDMETIFRYQGHGEASITSFLVLLGRLFYETNRFDRWKTALACVGCAGTGKSVLLQFVQHAFAPEDVFTISTNTQRGFGLENFHLSKLCAIPELKPEIVSKLEETVLQTMIAGGTVVAQGKGKAPVSEQWKLPIFACGNNLVSLCSVSESDVPICVVPFDKRVRVQDPALCDRFLSKSFVSFLIKSTVLYRQAASAHGDECVTSIFSDEMKEYASTMRARVNPIYEFLTKYCRVQEESFEELKVERNVFLNRFAWWLKEENREPISTASVTTYLRTLNCMEKTMTRHSEDDGAENAMLYITGVAFKDGVEW